MKYLYVPNNDPVYANALIAALADGYKIISAVGTKDGVQYVLELLKEKD